MLLLIVQAMKILELPHMPVIVDCTRCDVIRSNMKIN